MGWFDDVTGFIGKNSDWLKPVLSGVKGLYDNSTQDDSRDQIFNILKQREDRNFADTQAYNQAVQDYYNKYQSVSAANQAARSKMAAAYAAAQRQEMANQMAALKKAKKRENKGYKEALNYFAPLRDLGNSVIPNVGKTYNSSLDTMNLLNAYLMQPGNMAKLEQSKPAWQTDIPLPTKMLGRA